MPFSMFEKTVTMTPIQKIRHSTGETRQNLYTVLGGVIRSPTA